MDERDEAKRGRGMQQDVTRTGSGSLQTWLRRHAHPAPIERWRRADADNVHTAAFMLMAQDPGVLRRMESASATRLADQAERLAKQMRLGDTSAASLAATSVLDAIADWRRGRARQAPVEIVAENDYAAGTLGKLWKEALRSFPQFTENSARMCLMAVTEAGTPGLKRVQPPLDQLMVLGAVRYAAWCERNEPNVAQNAPPPEQVEEAVLIAQRWWKETGRSPFDVAYTGPGQAWKQALNLSRDAATCASIAARQPGGPGSTECENWELAEETHAYAAVSLNMDCVGNLDLDRARTLAAAASRFAAAAEASPADVAMPRFAPGADIPGAARVLRFLARVLPEGVPPRGSRVARETAAGPRTDSA